MQNQRKPPRRYDHVQATKSSKCGHSSASFVVPILCEFGDLVVVLDMASIKNMETIYQKVSIHFFMHTFLRSLCIECIWQFWFEFISELKIYEPNSGACCLYSHLKITLFPTLEDSAVNSMKMKNLPNQSTES